MPKGNYFKGSAYDPDAPGLSDFDRDVRLRSQDVHFMTPWPRGFSWDDGHRHRWNYYRNTMRRTHYFRRQFNTRAHLPEERIQRWYRNLRTAGNIHDYARREARRAESRRFWEQAWPGSTRVPVFRHPNPSPPTGQTSGAGIRPRARRAQQDPMQFITRRSGDEL